MRPHSPVRSLCIAAVIAALIAACSNARDITEPTRPSPIVASQRPSASAGSVMTVSDIEQLYAAVNDLANAGASIALAPGTYLLSAKDAAGADRPNAGRLELQQDMSLSGVAGNRAAVVIGNSARGVDVRNVGAEMAGRQLHAEIEDNAFFRGVEGIRVANFIGADGAHVTVTMSGNRSYENVLGCILENNRSSFATIHVRSSGDRFEDNGWGCQIGGALSSGGIVEHSFTIMEAHGTHFINNTRTEFFNGTGPTSGRGSAASWSLEATCCGQPAQPLTTPSS